MPRLAQPGLPTGLPGVRLAVINPFSTSIRPRDRRALGAHRGPYSDASPPPTDDHFFDTFTSRTCHGHPLPCNATGGCVSTADAARVFALGDFEYKCVGPPSVLDDV